jgi:hypothetical protein
MLERRSCRHRASNYACRVQPSERALPAVQRAYFYLVALVAIHMVVLALANLARVGAEIALGAPSGGFTGLPFLFADFSRPRELYREQVSLAIALLVVGGPAWFIHFRVAQRAAVRVVAERTSALRSFYIHLVVFVTALLVFGYGQRALRLILQGAVFGSGETMSPFFGLENDWLARAAGAAAMAATAAIVLWQHLRLSTSDRRATVIRGRAADLRHLVMYALAVVGLAWMSFTALSALNAVWDYVTNVLVPPLDFGAQPARGLIAPEKPSNAQLLRFDLVGDIPAIVAGLVLWLATWIPLQRGLRAASADADVERQSAVRRLAIYLVVIVAALAVLLNATIGITAILRRALGDALVEEFSSMQRELGGAVIGVVIFGAVWIFYRRVVAADASRETEHERAATTRRLYTYLIAAIGLAMTAIGTAGAIGVFGSQLVGINTHSHTETATYLALILVGGPAWAFSWWQARRRLDDDERRSFPRRAYLYLAVLGGVLGMLVFGSAALYRVLNAVLAASFPLATWHDIWHFAIDAGVSGAAFLFHVRVLRAERGAELASLAAFPVTVLVRAADAATARARITAALEGQADISIR